MVYRLLNLLASNDVTFPVLNHRLKYQEAFVIQNYEFKNPLADPYPGISACEAMIRNLFLTLKATRRPPAKAIAVQKKYLDSLP